MPLPSSLPRIIIENLSPAVDGGRYAVKREISGECVVEADIFMDGHDLLKAAVLFRPEGEASWRELPMTAEGNDRWSGSFPLAENTLHHYTILAWEDVFGSWARDTRKKIDAGLDVGLEVKEGTLLVEAALKKAKPSIREEHKASLDPLKNASPEEQAAILTGDAVIALMAAIDPRAHLTTYLHEIPVFADRVRARYGSWYEFFPRSQGIDPAVSSTFKECEARLPDIKAMGFDVVYLTPIHPIGQKNRKGKNNAVTADPGEPGSPYAVSDHRAVHPDLGTLEDFRRFLKATQAQGMEVAIDFAIQCAPDHVWVKAHPEWFVTRPDGTIKYAENPPKKYQDIVNVDFYGEGASALWEELRGVVLFWIEQGVKIFRVDNPHTKPLPFWEWLIGSVRERHPETIFLAEAFTRPAPMYSLAKAGFSQSYTYFTWRVGKAEITDYLEELSIEPVKDFFRPNFFANTPDILPFHLQSGGRPVFMLRAALAAMLAPSYGLYSGYEFCEADALPGKEEYLDSEKYEIKPRDWNKPGNIKEFIARLNYIRRENPALQHLDNLKFHLAWNDNVLFFSKATPKLDNIVFVAINLDPFRVQEAVIEMPLHEYGIDEYRPYMLDDLLQGHSWQWTGRRQFQHLDPSVNPVAIFRISR